MAGGRKGIVLTAFSTAYAAGKTLFAINMAAREAAITGPVNSSYKGLEQQYGSMIENTHMTTNLYEFSQITIQSTKGMSGDSVPADGVRVEITTKLNNQYAFVHLLEGIGIEVPKGYTIRYYMYNEKQVEDSGT